MSLYLIYLLIDNVSISDYDNVSIPDYNQVKLLSLVCTQWMCYWFANLATIQSQLRQ